MKVTLPEGLSVEVNDKTVTFRDDDANQVIEIRTFKTAEGAQLYAAHLIEGNSK
jgi:hypothetical protein